MVMNGQRQFVVLRIAWLEPKPDMAIMTRRTDHLADPHPSPIALKDDTCEGKK
ncbi:hypothetical protein J1N35_022087, partial [Gossypium stocksii]